MADATLLSLGVIPVWIHGAVDVLEAIVATGLPPKASAIQTMAGDTGGVETVPCGKRVYFDVVCQGEPKQFNPLTRPACCVMILVPAIPTSPMASW